MEVATDVMKLALFDVVLYVDDSGSIEFDDVNMLVSRVRVSGLTPLGTSLRSKVLEPMVVGPARAGRLEKPVLVITITDGQPAGEPHSTVGDAIRYAVDETSRTRYGRGAVSFQFSQVGNDQRAREFLSDLDEDPQIGNLIDCTSSKLAQTLCDYWNSVGLMT